MPSKITLQIDSVPTNNEYIRLKTGYSDNALTETFKTTRAAIYQSAIAAGSVHDTLTNFANAFNADYNSLSLFTLVLNYPSVQIEITHPDSGFFTVGNVDNQTNGSMTIISVADTADVTPINITDVSFSEATDACGDVQIDVTTDVLATIVRIGGLEEINPNSNNPFNFERLRGLLIALEVENSDGEKDNQNVQIPKLLSVSNTSISSINSPSGATVTIFVNQSTGLVLQYSLNNIDWFTSNIFTSILTGSHTAYIKDQLGCQIQKGFTIEDFEEAGIGISTPFVEVSESNSFRMAERVDFANNHKTDRNTLSNEAFAKDPNLAYKEAQQYLTTDIVTNQFKTNYDNVTAVIVKDDLSEVSLIIEKRTSYMSLKARLDAVKYNLGDSKTGIYFTSGKTYDPDTGADLDTHALNGGLPYWAVIGNYIYFDGAWFEIENIIFDESKFAKILVITNTYTGNDAVIDLSTIYNKENYETYEFDSNLSAYNGKYIQVRIDFDDTNFDSKVWLSELIHVADNQDDTVEIRFKNDTNTDIDYQYGIEGLIRIPINRKDSGLEDDSEIHKTDNQTVLLESKLFKLKKFSFEPVSDGIRWLIILALSRDIITIDGESYVKNGSSIEHQDALEDSNLYEITATMIKAGSGYNSNGEADSSFAAIDVPQLTKVDDTIFVKI